MWFIIMPSIDKPKIPTYPFLLELTCKKNKKHENPYTWTYKGFRTDYTSCPICGRQVWFKLDKLKKIGMVQQKVWRKDGIFFIFTGLN